MVVAGSAASSCWADAVSGYGRSVGTRRVPLV